MIRVIRGACSVRPSRLSANAMTTAHPREEASGTRVASAPAAADRAYALREKAGASAGWSLRWTGRRHDRARDWRGGGRRSILRSTCNARSAVLRQRRSAAPLRLPELTAHYGRGDGLAATVLALAATMLAGRGRTLIESLGPEFNDAGAVVGGRAVRERAWRRVRRGAAGAGFRMRGVLRRCCRGR